MVDDLCQSAKRWDTVGIQEGNVNDLHNISAHGVTLIADLEAESRASLPAIAIHARWSNAVRARRYFESGVAAIIQLGEDVFHVVSCYLPDTSKGNEALAAAILELNQLLDPFPGFADARKVLLMDANTALGRPFPGSRTGPNVWKPSRPTNRALQIISILQEHEIDVGNTMAGSSYPSWTHINNRWGTLHQIDFGAARNIQKSEIWEGYGRDHRPVAVHVLLDQTHSIPQRNQSSKGWKPKNDVIAADISERFSAEPDINTFGEYEEQLRKICLSAPSTLSHRQQSKYENTDTWEMQICDCELQLLPRGTPERHAKARELWKKRRAQRRWKAKQKALAEAMTCERADKKQTSHAVPDFLIEADGQQQWDQRQWPRVVHEFYTSLFTGDQTHDDIRNDIAELDAAVYNETMAGDRSLVNITRGRVRECMRKMPNNKSGHPRDQLVSEMIKLSLTIKWINWWTYFTSIFIFPWSRKFPKPGEIYSCG